MSMLCVFVISLKIVQCLDLNCDFKIYRVDGYNCKITKLYIDDEGSEISKLNGNHYLGKNDSNVEVLYIPSTNCIKFLPTNFGKYFTNLKKVEVSEACLKFISPNVFVGLNSLETVDIRKNLLSAIPGDTFDILVHLHTLMLSDNKIEKLETETFEKLTILKKLWLSGNSLEILQEKLFAKNFFLEEVLLSNNRLRIIDSGAFSHLKQLKSILLDRNFCISKSFPRDSSLDDLKAEFSSKCTNDTEIVKSSSYAEMTNEIHELRKNFSESSERASQLEESVKKSFATVGELIESYQANQTYFHEENQDLKFRLNEAYKTINYLKESFDSLQENYSKVEDNFNEMLDERIRQEVSRHNEAAEQLEISESFNASIRNALATTAFVLILLVIIVVLIVFIRCKVGKNANSTSTHDTEMQLNQGK